MNELPTYLGWTGMAMLLVAHAAKRRLPVGLLPVLNFFGAVLICVFCAAIEAWPPFVLNVFWAGVSVYDWIRKVPPPP